MCSQSYYELQDHHKRPPGVSWTRIPFNDLLAVYRGYWSIYYIFPVVSPGKLSFIHLVSRMETNSIFSQHFSIYNAPQCYCKLYKPHMATLLCLQTFVWDVNALEHHTILSTGKLVFYDIGKIGYLFSGRTSLKGKGSKI